MKPTLFFLSITLVSLPLPAFAAPYTGKILGLCDSAAGGFLVHTSDVVNFHKGVFTFVNQKNGREVIVGNADASGCLLQMEGIATLPGARVPPGITRFTGKLLAMCGSGQSQFVLASDAAEGMGDEIQFKNYNARRGSYEVIETTRRSCQLTPELIGRTMTN